MKLTSTVEYAARIMVRLAGLEPDRTMSAEKLAEAENIPRDFLDQILLRLRRAGLVTSRRGALGGYALAKPAEAISVGMVVRAVDHGVFEPVCEKYAEGEHACTHTSGCGIRPVWHRLGALVESFLDKVPLAELRREEPVVESRVNLFFQAARAEKGQK